MIREAHSPFENLTPDTILSAVESHAGLFLDGVITPYNSYVNRVFGVVDEDEAQYVAKFYRPGRWTKGAILEEHAFLADCADAEIPVIPPIPGVTGAEAGEGSTLGEYGGYLFAVFPRVRARSFDVAGDEDWARLGREVGRLHRAARSREAHERLRLTPEDTTARYLAGIRELVHPDCLGEFTDACDEALALIAPLFARLGPESMRRIHGDLHRGNILRAIDRASGAETLIVIDFDDMMAGPAVQDLWLLLPDHLGASMREMNLLLEGYGEFCDFDRSTLDLVEPLRFMRHVYFLAWCAIQRNDVGFADRYPGWGNKAFWIAETEDLSAQLDWIRQGLVY